MCNASTEYYYIQVSLPWENRRGNRLHSRHGVPTLFTSV